MTTFQKEKKGHFKSAVGNISLSPKPTKGKHLVQKLVVSLFKNGGWEKDVLTIPTRIDDNPWVGYAFFLMMAWNRS
ncbi:hypothetical protein Gasu2_45980 [Galdieria sulphuraria]|nr:hypothetical protein Gasu2_45980 [Galdieria sulphuraria]